MNLNKKNYRTELDGEEVNLEISRLAGKANAAVLARHGDTTVLATVVMGKQDISSDYFPLTVDYEERFYAAGKIIGSRFIRREGRPTDEATLSARLIDRTIRPLFDQRLRREVQVVITILSYDEKNDPDTIGLLAASTALGISDVPWDGPVAGVKIKSVEGEKNFTAFFAGTETKINMLEFEGPETEEREIVKLFENSQKTIKNLIAFQKKIINEIGRPKAAIKIAEADPKIKNIVWEFLKNDLEKAVSGDKLNDLKTKLFEHLTANDETAENLKSIEYVFENIIDEFLHAQIMEKEKRPDGRKLDEVRDLYAEIALFRRTHGSALFIRGETQVLAVTTLGSPAAEQLVETMETTGKKRFMLHYNFPSFSTGETKRRGGGPGRREIGHGALAAKAVNALIPSKEEFPYTIRVVAETLSSNGSSSMASTCATSLSLMDAGVPMKKHVAGIAMGLILDLKTQQYKILTDIQGPEDHYGDMDLKVAGTENGVTAAQMDVKMEGITSEIFEKSLMQAKKARLHILDTMNKTLPKHKPQISDFAPAIFTLNIPPEKIGLLIGPGGKTINGIIAQAGGKQTAIDIEEDGRVFVSSIDRTAAEKALALVNQVLHEYKVGETIEGDVIKLLDFGAIVDLGGGKDGMIHISEVKDGFVKKIDDVIKMGDHVRAKIIKAEEGKIGLSIKQLNK